jgi:hypothetical protein
MASSATASRVHRRATNSIFVVRSIAFSPKEALQEHVVDMSWNGFLATMDVSCWTFIRMAHLAEPLMRKGGTLFTMTYYDSRMVVKNCNIMAVAKAALECAVRYIASLLMPMTRLSAESMRRVVGSKFIFRVHAGRRHIRCRSLAGRRQVPLAALTQNYTDCRCAWKRARGGLVAGFGPPRTSRLPASRSAFGGGAAAATILSEGGS